MNVIAHSIVKILEKHVFETCSLVHINCHVSDSCCASATFTDVYDPKGLPRKQKWRCFPALMVITSFMALSRGHARVLARLDCLEFDFRPPFEEIRDKAFGEKTHDWKDRFKICWNT